eukprot:11347137-Alexandrium_andersonii.AAC.1
MPEPSISAQWAGMPGTISTLTPEAPGVKWPGGWNITAPSPANAITKQVASGRQQPSAVWHAASVKVEPALVAAYHARRCPRSAF